MNNRGNITLPKYSKPIVTGPKEMNNQKLPDLKKKIKITVLKMFREL